MQIFIAKFNSSHPMIVIRSSTFFLYEQTLVNNSLIKAGRKTKKIGVVPKSSLHSTTEYIF